VSQRKQQARVAVPTLSEQDEEVRGGGPDSKTAEERHEETEVPGSRSGLRLHLHRVTVGLAILVAASIQLAWLAVLGYGLVKLFK
jgi:hypothetical protein